MKELEEDGPAPAITRTSAIYERLRREIIQGTLLPGEKLRIEVLRSQIRCRRHTAAGGDESPVH
jgi:DNA-binding GntR family transcriptional regulator